MVLLSLILTIVNADDWKSLVVSVNKVWPQRNPVETYRYYDFPVCAPETITPLEMSLGQILRGDRIMNSVFTDIHRGVNASSVVTCTKTFTSAEITQLTNAIRNQYMFELIVDGLSATAPLGTNPVPEVLNICTHLRFELTASGDGKVTRAKLGCKDYTNLLALASVSPPTTTTFSYSVEWVDWVSPATTPTLWSIHWISILNSFMLTLMIVALVSVVLIKVVRADILLPMESGMTVDSKLEMGDGSDDGLNVIAYWKLLHGDIFRPPVHRMWICAAVGSGTQLLFVLSAVSILGTVWTIIDPEGGAFYQRGTLITTGVVIYMLSATISGYVSSRMYVRIGGVKWSWNILVTSLFFTGPAFAIWGILNNIAIAYNSTAAFPFSIILQLFVMWALVTIPLTVLGGIIGRQSGIALIKSDPFPTRTNRLAREIPKYPFLSSMRFQILLTGFITFWSIYIELKFILESVWAAADGPLGNYRLYGALVISGFLVILLSLSLTILFTYFQLNAENYKWWWRSFIAGGSVALFVFGYCVYYYANSIMDGFFQTSFFFLYSALLAYAVALMVGTVSFLSTYRFVWFLYSHVKSD